MLYTLIYTILYTELFTDLPAAGKIGFFTFTFHWKWTVQYGSLYYILYAQRFSVHIKVMIEIYRIVFMTVFIILLNTSYKRRSQ